MANIKKLSLIFPQWQGGKLRVIEQAALSLAEKLNLTSSYQIMEIDGDEDRLLENNIVGYKAIVNNLSKVFDLIASFNPGTINVIGGDCSVSVAPVAYLNEKYSGDLLVLWLDAHGDLNSPAESFTKAFHGMPLRFLLGEGDSAIIEKITASLTPRQIILAGLRDIDESEERYIDNNNVTVVKPQDIVMSPQTLFNIMKLKGYENVYIHLDTDVLDPEEFDKCGYPTPGGISMVRLNEILDFVKYNFNLIGFSLTEFLPCSEKAALQLREIIEKAAL